MKRLLIVTCMLAVLVFLFTISASAAMTGSTSNEFGEKISLDGMSLKGMATDDGSRVVLAHTVDGVTYYNTYPANYIVTDKSYNRIDYANVNAALSTNGETFAYDDTSVIRLEMPTSSTNTNGEVKAMSNLKELIFLPGSSQTSFKIQEFLNATFERIVIPSSITTTSNGNVFNNCTNLKEVVFEEGFSCTSLGNGWFSGCTALETITIPSSVTSLGSNFFNGCTALEEVHMENVTSFGQYWLVNCSDGIKIYVSDGVTSFGQISYNNTSPKAVVFYVGSYDGASAIKTGGSNPTKNASLVEYDITKPDSYYVPEAPEAWTIVYNYNVCNAFHGRIHDIEDEPKLNFKDLLSEFSTSAYCNRCKMTSNIESYGAVFKMYGYSAKIGGDDICVSYSINKTAYEGYKKVTGKEISFGAVAKILTDNQTEAAVLTNDNGTLTHTGKIINAPVPMNVGSVSFRIKGFSADASYYALSLVMCTYIFDGEKINYICYNADGEVSQLATARAVTFNQLAT